MSLNECLLNLLSSKKHFDTDLDSVSLRLKKLTIIYINLINLLSITLYTLFLWLHMEFTDIHLTIIFISIMLFGFGFSIRLMNLNKDKAAATFTIFYLQAMNLAINSAVDMPLVGLTSTLIFPTLSSFLSLYSKAQIINIIVSYSQVIFYALRCKDVFAISISVKNSFQLVAGLSGFLIVSLYMYVSGYIQKRSEKNLIKTSKKDYQKMERHAKELENIIDAEERFMTHLSNSIKNSYTHISEDAYSLRKQYDDNFEYINEVKRVEQNKDLLRYMLNHSLDATKLKTNKLEFTYSKTTLEDVFNKVLDLYNENLQKAGLSVEIAVYPNVPKLLYIEANRLTQILINLLSNAIKSSPKGGKIEIKAKWCKDGYTKEKMLGIIKENRAVHTVLKSKQHKSEMLLHESSFDVPSIERAESDNVFAEFSLLESDVKDKNFELLAKSPLRADVKLPNLTEKSEKNSPQGVSKTGINNYILKSAQLKSFESIASPESMLGCIKLQVSDSGSGIEEKTISSLFDLFSTKDNENNKIDNLVRASGIGLWVCKQLCLRMEGDLTLYSKINNGTTVVFYIPVNNNNILNGDLSAGKLLIDKEKVHVLVVDDYAFNRDLHKLILEQQGVHVVVASDGKEAVNIFNDKGHGYFDFIMMDVQMPVMDGFTAALLIKESAFKKNKKIDIFFVSGEYYQEEELFLKFKKSDNDTFSSMGISSLKKPINTEIIKNIVDKYKVKLVGSKNSIASPV